MSYVRWCRNCEDYKESLGKYSKVCKECHSAILELKVKEKQK
jgi:hypothetical protein